MSALPRPALPAGAHRDLNDALHDLHHRAGWPSLRTLGKQTGVSHTTVSKAFSATALPSWGTLELLVETMDGDTTAFHDLWLAASSTGPDDPAPTPRIAGRRAELSAVRRHLETGTGLLLVTGEAGMGKTTLVDAATQKTDTFIATGHCLPLSSAVPLMPVADLLRSVLRSDGGDGWWRAAVDGCPPWTTEILTRLLPELTTTPTAAPDDSPNQVVGVAVRLVLEALASRRALAVVLEDLHWADTATLELWEHLLTGPTVPVVGTWRLDDVSVAPANAEWFTRVRRMATVSTLALEALSAEETGHQMALLTGREPTVPEVEATYARTRGLPLFTEQLAAESPDADTVPRLLSDLLDTRLGQLTGPTWVAARVLGVAERPLTSAVIATGTGLDPREVTDALRVLGERHLLATVSESAVTVRHPLLAEAIQRRTMVGEREEQHAGLARALAESPDPVPAEVAHHWRAAGRPDEELTWRIRAARAAHDRIALRHEVRQWVRAIELWPQGAATAGDDATRRYDALLAALDIIGGVTHEHALMLIADAEALIPDLAPSEAAELQQRMGNYLVEEGEVDRGLALIHGALDIYEAGPPTEGHGRALFVLACVMRQLGRAEEAASALSHGLEVARTSHDLRGTRRLLAMQSWIDVLHGRHRLALQRLDEARAVPVEGMDPRGDVMVAGALQDALMLTGGDVEDVLSAGRWGLAAADAWGLDTLSVLVLRFNMALALRRAGRVGDAADLLSTGEPIRGRLENLLQFERAALAMLQGRAADARDLVDALDSLEWSSAQDQIELGETLAEVETWTGRAGDALRRLLSTGEALAPTEASRDLAPVLVRAASAASAPDAALAERLSVLLARCARDPFAERGPADRPALAATWRAEIDRLSGGDTVAPWAKAAEHWGRLRRPHDAAYCRWRGAQAALREGRGTVAARLLARAATDSREHVPLSRAIVATREGR
ncbi:ATP-binding protein [Nocardioides currus]|uniref:Orc1-like AAA ATPase domain-containing protein n=1 Tax=Nocardioides currus TaxID=2133958 RepID=A0A2R7Z0S0_9ACTN|nr:tetratricopeptide repeat protein [Nocardioides currus]PUA82228.1 hypothetical protein C7S10_00225 [Nocardioides currus]